MANEKETKEEVKKEPITVQIDTEKHGDFLKRMGYEDFNVIKEDSDFFSNLIDRAKKDGHGGAKEGFQRSLIASIKEIGIDGVDERDFIDNAGKTTNAIVMNKIKKSFDAQIDAVRAEKKAGNIDTKDAEAIEKAIQEAKKQAIEDR